MEAILICDWKQSPFENFRGYLKPTTLHVADFTTIVGRNDVGKSTLLEALDIFFNDGKPDFADANVEARDRPTRISCKFDELPLQVVLDAQAPTTLMDEHLLNAEGQLEIVKEFNFRNSKPTVKVFSRAQYPTVEGAHDLLQLTNAKLKQRVRQLRIDTAGVNLTVNASIRRSIWANFSDLVPCTQLVPLASQDGKQVWDQLQKELPTFALFQADRRSRDDDSEVTDPFDMAIKDAVRGLEAKLGEIKEEVQKKVQDVAERTLTKLREMDANLASALRPVFKAEPKWAGFKLSLIDQRGISINKRGSGVRRLILINFFRAEAERRQKASDAPGIIYAIEEPESSQHPTNQRLLIEALQQLSESGEAQVIITTHVPGVAGLASPDSIRLLEHDEEEHPRVVSGDDLLERVADQLGILPDHRVCLLLFVEGPNDVAFFEKASRLIGLIDLTNDPRVALIPVGGGTLKHWVDRRYLRNLQLPEIHIYDRDEDEKYQKEVDEVNGRGNRYWATLTDKREMENYFHPNAVRTEFGIDIPISDDADVPMVVARALHEASSQSPYTWEELSEAKQKKKAKNVKRRLWNEALDRMTLDQLQNCDPNGEVEGWFRRITATLDGHQPI